MLLYNLGAGSSSGLIGSKVAGIKGRSAGSSLQTTHDLRVGVTHAYIVFAQTMGGRYVFFINVKIVNEKYEYS